MTMTKQGEEEKQAQICAEGCEEEYITRIFQIEHNHDFCILNGVLQD